MNLHRFLKINTVLFLSTLSLFVSSCRKGGEATLAPLDDKERVFVTSPTIVSPSTSVFASKDTSLTISGLCTQGNIVALSGSAGSTTVCLNSTYSFTVSTIVDGIYVYSITQVSSDGTISTPTSFVWNRKSSIAQPVVTSPITNPYLSSESAMTISGTCESGSTVTLELDGVGSTACSNSMFSIILPKFIDGNYSIRVKQTDLAGNSASTEFIWQKRSLITTPTNPLIQAGSSQVFSIAGGTGSYTTAIITNNSGATYDPSTSTYTAGPIAGAIDILRITDSANVSVDVTISVIAATPDHLLLLSGDAQSTLMGSQLSDEIRVKVVDRYGNGISSYPLYFQITQGQMEFLDSPLQTTNLLGEAAINLKMGTLSLKNRIVVSPFNASLPDESLTGTPNLEIEQIGRTTNNGAFGPLYIVGQNPNRISSGDINKDGKQDVLVLNSGDPSIGILLGQANYLFSPMTKITGICSSPSGLSVVDINGDSNLDFVISCGGSASFALQVRLGNGDGTFGSSINTNLDSFENIPSYLHLADINNDGRLDAINTNTGSANVSVRLGNGNGTFSTPGIFPTGTSPVAVTSIDINKDGFLDLAIANTADSTVSLLMGDGTGQFGTKVDIGVGASPSALVAGNFDGDTYNDLIVVNYSDSNVSVLINDQLGGFTPGASPGTGTSPNGIISGNFNGDSFPDLLVSNSDDNTITFLAGLGNGNFSTGVTYSSVINPSAINVSDLDGDSIQDILVVGVGNRELQILAGLNSGQFGLEYATAASPQGVNLIDINNNNILDVVVVSPTSKTLQYYLNDGKGKLSSPTQISLPDSSTMSIGAPLVSRDKQDLIVNFPNQAAIGVYLNQGSNTFSTVTKFTVGSGPEYIASGDFNLDGKVDLAVANSTSNSISILLGVGDGSFLGKTDYSTGSTPGYLAIGDINNDNFLDIVVSNRNSATIQIFLGNGNGTFQTGIATSVASSPEGIVISDINGDGAPDIIVNCTNDNLTGVAFGNGDGSLRTPAYYSSGDTPKLISSSDFNGDTRLDLVVSNDSGRTFNIVFGSGIGQFNTNLTFPLNGSIPSISSGDLNNDNKTDIISLDSTNSRFTIWLGH